MQHHLHKNNDASKIFFLLFRAANYWFYVPVVATHIGAIVGCTLYDLLIGWHIPPEQEGEGEQTEEQDSNKLACC